jgi:PPOX class probable F420-dependent enzyme
MPFTIDPSTDFGARVAKHLAGDQVVWLTTVRANGTPEPSPVWFHWDGEAIWIYSRDNSVKVRNISDHPAVSLNFNATEHGGDVVVITGTAEILRDGPRAEHVPGYVTKYTGGFESINRSPAKFSDDYSVPIRITPTNLRGF